MTAIAAANWLIIAGIVLAMLGIMLRTIMMMRSSDAISTQGRAMYGRELLQEYRRSFPQSAMPLITRSCLIVGTVFLLAGVALALRLR